MQKSKYTLLFIEDEREIRENYVTSLKNIFQKVYEADSGLEAFEIYLDKKPDILIVDINIFDIDGLEFIKRVRERDLSVKVIVLTSYSDSETLLRATELKLTKYLIKPVKRKELYSALNLAIEEINKFHIVSNNILTLKNNFSWDRLEKKLYYNSKSLKLTKTEKAVISFILERPKFTSTYDELLYAIWNESSEKTLKNLQTVITNIRHKLPDELIVNDYAIGYKIQ